MPAPEPIHGSETATRPAGPEPAYGLLSGGLLTTEQLAKRVGVDTSTVRRWRTQEPMQGPPFIRLSERVVMYSLQDVEQWLRESRVDPRRAA
jgi:predicted DNA-binding transcriptional regulator AlpA